MNADDKDHDTDLRRYIPADCASAELTLKHGLRGHPAEMTKAEFLRVWFAAAYLYPGLHPDGYDHPDSGWPSELVVLARDAWRRADAGELEDTELYPADAAWARLWSLRTSVRSLTDKEINHGSH